MSSRICKIMFSSYAIVQNAVAVAVATDEIVEIGYQYAKPKVKAWAEANRIKSPP